MIQRNVRLIKKTGIATEILIVTGEDQQELIEMQVGSQGVTIVTEPGRRDTFPAIYLACAYLCSKGVAAEETILVMPCDTFACEEYYSHLKEIAAAVENKAAGMVLMGITPTNASSKFGYIIPDNKPHKYNIQEITNFVEKPDQQTASRLIDSGALWNSGVCGFELGFLMTLGEKVFKSTDYQTLLRDYELLPKLNFSYDVLEKSNSSAVVTFSGEWKDLGTWNELTNELAKNEYGPVISSGCKDTIVVNELGKPLICIGCDNLVIVATYDGILVAERSTSENIKPLVDTLTSKPKFEEHIWGESRIIETIKTVDNTDTVDIINLTVDAASAVNCKRNRNREAILIVTDGRGQMELDGQINNLERNSIVHIPTSAPYTLKAQTSMNIILVQRKPCGEDNADSVSTTTSSHSQKP